MRSASPWSADGARRRDARGARATSPALTFPVPRSTSAREQIAKRPSAVTAHTSRPSPCIDFTGYRHTAATLEIRARRSLLVSCWRVARVGCAQSFLGGLLNQSISMDRPYPRSPQGQSLAARRSRGARRTAGTEGGGGGGGGNGGGKLLSCADSRGHDHEHFGISLVHGRRDEARPRDGPGRLPVLPSRQRVTSTRARRASPRPPSTPASPRAPPAPRLGRLLDAPPTASPSTSWTRARPT